MLNALTIDVEEYFQVEAFASQIPRESWEGFAPRVAQCVDRALEILARHDVRATFFVMGWVAEKHPGLVRRIADAGHEIGCHSYAHQRIHRLSPEEFREDIRKARGILQDQAGAPVFAYRAPSFSIVRATLWAVDMLAEEGFRFDSSIFPVRHDLYGIPDAERFPHWQHTAQGSRLFEFPPSTVRRFGNNFGVGGGGWMRLAPYGFTRWALRRINESERQPVMVYFHPWELDPDQPRLDGPLRSRLRHYVNLSTMAGKVDRLLTEFKFAPISKVCAGLTSYAHAETEPAPAIP